MDKEILIKYCNNGLSTYKIAKLLGIGQTSVRYWLKKYNLSTRGHYSFDEDVLKKVISESISYHEILVKLGRNSSANSYKTLKRAIKRLNIDVSHLMSRSEVMKQKYAESRLTINELFVENSLSSRSTIKRRILSHNLMEYKCSICKHDDIWNGQKLVLILDHINGINNDNRLSNLRFVCPNCNSQLLTHCRNVNTIKRPLLVNKKREYRKKYIPRIKNRKVERPDIEILKRQINELGYIKTGKLYGVSDNSIRKWIKWASNQS